uniref:Uncharacterized protein n=1 Tax=Solanum lycopersicum TaxID=4081 RepID=A0A494GAB6_SOLLC
MERLLGDPNKLCEDLRNELGNHHVEKMVQSFIFSNDDDHFPLHRNHLFKLILQTCLLSYILFSLSCCQYHR